MNIIHRMNTIHARVGSSLICGLLLMLGAHTASAHTFFVRGANVSADGLPTTTLYRHQPAKSRADSEEGALAALSLPMGVAASGTPSGVELTGTFHGAWERVTGWLTFPYEEDNGLELQVLLRGFEGSETESGHYTMGHWQGKIFWIDLGDGVPRLLPAQLWNADYIPDPDELPAQAGRLYHSGYLLYRQAGVSYPTDQWEEGAAWVDLWFVMDANDDQVLGLSIDVLDDDGNYIESRQLAAGDALQIFTNAYDLTEPDVVYLMDYMEMKTLNGEPNVSHAHRLPNIDFTDTDLALKAVAGFDTSRVNLELLLEGMWADENDEIRYGYSNPPMELGYTWGEARQIASGVVVSDPDSSGGGGGAMLWLPPLLGLLTVLLSAQRRRAWGRWAS